MNNRDISEHELDMLIESSMSDLPPDGVVTDVTPWRRAMTKVLCGFALTSVTLNFLNLNYILPAIGILLLLIGFRRLRDSGGWFKACYILSVVRVLMYILTSVPNTTVYAERIRDSALFANVGIFVTVITVLTVICMRNGCSELLKKVSAPCGYANAFLVWYIVLCALALLNYSGVVLSLVLLVSYALILYNLYKLMRSFESAGYAVKTARVKVPDTVIVIGIAAITASLMLCGYQFFSTYNIKWQEKEDSYADYSHLVSLGVPEYVLKDLHDDEIKECDGAIKAITRVETLPMNSGRQVVTVEGNTRHYDVVYDKKEMQVTTVAVKLNDNQYKLIHHFEWVESVDFISTEAIMLDPETDNWLIEHSDDGFVFDGRLLFTDGDTDYVSDISFADKTQTSFFGTSSYKCAEFSFENRGIRQRGYVTYNLTQAKTGCGIASRFDYTHGLSKFQYPVKTALSHRLVSIFDEDNTFITAQSGGLIVGPNEV